MSATNPVGRPGDDGSFLPASTTPAPAMASGAFRRKWQHYTADETQVIKDMVERGFTAKEIGQKLGRTGASIRLRMSMSGLRFRPGARWARIVREMIDARNRGLSNSKIAEMHGVTKSCVENRWQRIRAIAAKVGASVPESKHAPKVKP